MANFDPFGKLAEVERYKQQMNMKAQAINEQRRQNVLARYQQKRANRIQDNALVQAQKERERVEAERNRLTEGRAQVGAMQHEMSPNFMGPKNPNLPEKLTPEYLYGAVGPEVAKEYKGVIPKETRPQTSSLFKLIQEREQAVKSFGEEHPMVTAYDNKILGTDIDVPELDQDEIDVLGSIYLKTGKNVSGRGKIINALKAKVVKSATSQALGRETGPKSSDVASNIIGDIADVKAIGQSIGQQTKQLGSMRSFVDNLGMQVDKVGELSQDLKTFDTRLLNIPLRKLRGRLAGSALQAKYDMYLAEIEAEIGKLATGSTGSVAELSQGAQEKWAKIHDKKLSVTDMLDLLQETKKAGFMRLKSVERALGTSRKELRNVGKKKSTQGWSIQKVN